MRTGAGRHAIPEMPVVRQPVRRDDIAENLPLRPLRECFRTGVVRRRGGSCQI
jgi:hypothetical protein